MSRLLVGTPVTSLPPTSMVPLSGSSRPARVHFREPSFVNLQSLRDMTIGEYVADLIQTLAMLDPILGGIDR